MNIFYFFNNYNEFKMLRQFIVKVSVLGYFPLHIYVRCTMYNVQHTHCIHGTLYILCVITNLLNKVLNYNIIYIYTYNY